MGPCILRLQGEDANVKIMMAIHVADMVVAGTKADCDGLREYTYKLFVVHHLR